MWVIGRASFSDDTNFSVSGLADSQFDADEFSASIHTNYNFYISNFSIGPKLGLDWVRNNYESYNETGSTGLELNFNKDHRTSLLSRVGVESSAAFSTTFGVILPQVGFDWIHEFENDQREISFNFVEDLRQQNFTFQNEKPDRDFFEFSVGSSIVMAHGVQAFINYRTILGHSYFNGHTANLGMRLEF